MSVEQSHDFPSASEAALENMGEIDQYKTTTIITKRKPHL